VLVGRIKTEYEEKEMIPQNQIGFRKGMGTVDNICVLNYIINKQLGIGKKVMAVRGSESGFDSVDRGVLYKAMSEKEIRKELIERVKEVLGKQRVI